MKSKINQLHKEIRLRDFDYSQEGGYFITICANNRKSILGKIENGKIKLSPIGEVVKRFWLEIPHHFKNVKSDAFVIMPNHLHGIIFLIEKCRGGVSPPNHKGEVTSLLQKPILGQIIAYYKYKTTKFINASRHTPSVRVWQRNYFEHVIRSQNELNHIRQYILDNPLKWALDRENPASNNFDLDLGKYFKDILEK